MIYKASPHKRDYWGKFSLKLQEYSITDLHGKVQNKREVFDKLYVEGGLTEYGQVDLALLMCGMHQKLLLVRREAFDDSLQQDIHIKEVTTDELKTRAINLARGHNIDNFDMTIDLMVLAMGDVLENHRQIEQNIKTKLQGTD